MSTPTKSPVRKTPATAESRNSNVMFLFDRMNYYIIGAGVLLLVIGYVLMSGGAQAPNEFNESEIYSFRRVTLAPIVVVLGYAVIAYGIMKKPAEGND
jgi:hypothetical protein